MYEVSREIEIAFFHIHDELATFDEETQALIYPEGHGHSASVELVFRLETLNEHGMILENESFGDQKAWLIENVDRKNINELMQANGSPQNLAKFIYDSMKPMWSQLYRVTIRLDNARIARYFEAALTA